MRGHVCTQFSFLQARAGFKGDASDELLINVRFTHRANDCRLDSTKFEQDFLYHRGRNLETADFDVCRGLSALKRNLV